MNNVELNEESWERESTLSVLVSVILLFSKIKKREKSRRIGRIDKLTRMIVDCKRMTVS